MKLDSYSNPYFSRGASTLVELTWICLQYALFSTFIPGSFWRRKLLALFGAKIGSGVIIKQGVRIKFPWKLIVGDNCWIGENVWVDNLDRVEIGSNCCISQGVYLCTGSHNWCKATFDLITKPIVIGEQVWIGAFCKVAPGVRISNGSVCVMGTVLTKSTGEWEIWAGNPCQKIKVRPRN